MKWTISNVRKVPSLPDEMLLYLAKNHLSERDCLALALSGEISERFAALHGENKKCNISRCYFLGPERWMKYFWQYIDPTTITIFNVNHCYWMPPGDLVLNAMLMKNLEELNVLDTQVSLEKLGLVFTRCQKIIRLGLSLAGLKSLDDFVDRHDWTSVECAKECFKRLTHLSIFNFEVNRYDLNNPRHCLTAWPVTLGVLSWCQNCKDLKIDISYRDLDDESDEYEDCDSDVEDWEYTISCKKFPRRLEWMSSLESLIITRRVWHGFGKDCYVAELLEWLLKRKTNSLRRLWVDDNSDSLRRLPLREMLCAPSVTSFCLGEGDCLNSIDVDDQRFRHIQHLGGFGFPGRLDEFPDLKYVRAHCYELQDITALAEFCDAHPLLESLHFSTELFDHEPNLPPMEPGRWKLLKLKDLVYQCSYPDQRMMEHLIEACPNIESLLVGDKSLSNGRMPASVDFLAAIRFNNLRSLTLVGFQLLDGSFLSSILKQCPKLERLHLTGNCVPDTFLLQVGQCLPKATKLRDLRLQLRSKAKVSSILLLLKNLLQCSEHLERLVLNNAYSPSVLKASSQIGDLLVGFATEMDHLVALCLVGFCLRPKVIRKVHRRVKKEILPVRPAFWLYVDGEPPGENDIRIPRVHYDEIVNPIDGFYAPPLRF